MNERMINQSTPGKKKFFYGYVIVIASFFILMAGYGMFNIYGVFFQPLLNEFGWTRAVTSGAFSLGMLLSGVAGILMGGLNDRFGSRLVLTFCGIVFAAGFLLMSTINNVWQLYLFFGVVVGAGLSGIWVPLLSTVARWFEKRRSMMTGIVLSGMGIGLLIAPLLVSRLIEAYDWRTSYVILGIVLFVIIVVAAQFLKRVPEKKEALPGEENHSDGPEMKPAEDGLSLREAARTRPFWMIMVMFFCFGFCLFALMVHIVPHAIGQGVSAVTAANFLAILGGMGVVGNYTLGSLGDKIGSKRIFIIGFVVWTAILFWLAMAGGIWLLYVFAVLFGFAEGGMGPSESPLVADYFGLKSHGLIFGVIDFGFPIGAAVGPLVTGYIFDLTSSYQGAFLVCAVVALLGVTMTLMLRSHKKSLSV